MGAAAVVAVLAGRPGGALARAAAGGRGDAGAQPARARGRRLAAELRGGGRPSSLLAGARPRRRWSGAGCRAASPRRRRSPPRRRSAPRRSSRRTSARPRWSRCRPTCWPRPRWRRSCGSAMLAVALGQVGTALAAPFVALAGFPVAYVMWVAHVASGVPGAQASVPPGRRSPRALRRALAAGARARVRRGRRRARWCLASRVARADSALAAGWLARRGRTGRAGLARRRRPAAPARSPSSTSARATRR